MYICDWTHWQGNPAPAVRIADEGFGAVKMKAGGATKEGWSFIDPVFASSARAVQEEGSLVPFAFWYLVPGRPVAQAGLFCDLIREANKLYPGHLNGWALELDVEQVGLTAADVANFLESWLALTNEYPIIVYSNKTLWDKCCRDLVGSSFTHHLEEAHWVSESVRYDGSKPYASQHFHGVDPKWWDVDYGGWHEASILQFTNRAVVAGKMVPCSYFNGSRQDFRSLFTR